MHQNIITFLASPVAAEHVRRIMSTPEPFDLSNLAKLAAKDRRRPGTNGRLIGPRPYEPRQACSAKLLLKEAVYYGFEQNSWDDTHAYVVPVEGDCSSEACKENLRDFCESIRTANGLAGFGSTWETIVLPAFGVVVFRQRSSISD